MCHRFGILAKLCFLSSEIWPTSSSFSKCQNEYLPLIHMCKLDCQIGPIPLWNYSSAALNTNTYEPLGGPFKSALLYAFYSGSSCKFDLYLSLPGSSEIPFSTVSSQKEISQGNTQYIVFNKVLKYESFSTARKKTYPTLFHVVIYFP